MATKTKFGRVMGVAICLTVFSAMFALSGRADHSASGCFPGHEGVHSFPLTDAKVTVETANNPLLGPFAGKSDDVVLNGPTTVRAEIVDADTMATEIVEMDLAGNSTVFGPVYVSESAALATVGEVQAGFSSCFPAQSFFDVYVQLDGPFVAHTHEPFHVEVTLDDLPPQSGAYYEGGPVPPVVLLSGPSHDGSPPPGEFEVGAIYHAKHGPNADKAWVQVPPESEEVPVPALGQWALVTLAALLASVGFVAARRR